MQKIALIGAGQLGSRYLQGLSKSDLEISIEIVEPFLESQRMAKLRYEEMPTNNKIKNIKFFENILKLSNELDIVIVATSSDVRYKITKELLETKKVKYLILEKVLFQKIEEYQKIEELLKLTKTKCWVNHPRRMFPFYQNLKQELRESKYVNFHVSGGNWGLGCNGLHFMDCFAYLVSSLDIKLNTKFIDNKLYKSKRNGFNEFNGLMTGKIENHSLTMNCFDGNHISIQLSIVSDTLNVMIDEANGLYFIAKKENNWKYEIKKEKILYFQSELTPILIEDIFNNKCCLSTYNEAMKLHIKFLESLIGHINSFSNAKYNYCPIT